MRDSRTVCEAGEIFGRLQPQRGGCDLGLDPALHLAFTRAALQRAQRTAHLANLIGTVEKRNRLVQPSIGDVLDTAAQRQQFVDHGSLNDVESERER